MSTQKHFFAYRRKADLSFPLVLPRYHHLACLPASVRAALKTPLYKSRSMLSIDGGLVLKFHSRQNLFSKIPWHLLKTRHLVRNSSDRQLFPKNLPYRSLSTTTRREIWLEIPLGPNFFCDASLILFRSLLSITVLYSSLQFVTARHMPADLRSFSFHRSRLFHADSNRPHLL